MKRAPRRRVFRWLVVAAGVYFASVYVEARVDRVAMREGGAPATLPPAPSTRVAGAIHVHTRRSHDAIGSEAELARAARAAGLDFVFLADHRDAGSPAAEWERIAAREEGVLLVRGQEIRVEGVGKVLVDRVDTAVVSWTGGAPSFLARVERDSAFTVVAHPRGRRSDAWRPEGALGMDAWEVFDFADVARRRLASPSALYHVVSLVGGELAGRSEQGWLRLYGDGFGGPGVAAFDSLWVTGGPGRAASDRRPTAVGGLDMHPKARLPGGRLFPDYASSLRTMVNHVALDQPTGSEPAEAARALGMAIRRGDVFVSFGDAAAARGFRVGIEATEDRAAVPAAPVAAPPAAAALPAAPSAAGSRAALAAAGAARPSPGHTPPGGTTAMGAGLLLKAGFATDPGRVAYRVVRDGREVGWWRGPGLAYAVETPGAYRVEVFRYSLRVGGLVWNLRPWIFANPILVVPSHMAANP